MLLTTVQCWELVLSGCIMSAAPRSRVILKWVGSKYQVLHAPKTLPVPIRFRKPLLGLCSSFPSGGGKFYPPTKSKGSPLRMKNRKNCRNDDLDSSKEGFWRTECNAKNLRSLRSTIAEKTKKNRLKIYIFYHLPIFNHFESVFLDFFRNGTSQRAEVFCVAFSASKPNFWAI